VRYPFATITAALVAFAATSAFGAATIRSRGKIEIAAGMPLVAVSTDPLIQRVLNEDFYAARRAAHGEASVATITVTLTERALKPGVSLNDVAPGDPGILALLRAAGATTPPIGDTGASQVDPFENAARTQALRPDNPAIEQLRQQQAFNKAIGMPGAGGPYVAHNAADDEGYDRVTVARVSVDDQHEQLMVVAVAHPGDDARETKKLVAEAIANAALH
jgi:hypothetical protein